MITYSLKVPVNGEWITAASNLSQLEAMDEARAFTRFIIEEE